MKKAKQTHAQTTASCSGLQYKDTLPLTNIATCRHVKESTPLANSNCPVVQWVTRCHQQWPSQGPHPPFFSRWSPSAPRDPGAQQMAGAQEAIFGHSSAHSFATGPWRTSYVGRPAWHGGDEPVDIGYTGTHSAHGQTHMKPLRTGLDGRSLHLSLVVDDDSCVVLATVIWLGVKTKLGPHRVHAENWV